MRVIVTEKPSVARDLAKVLGVGGRGQGVITGDGLTITWCVGHLVELEEPSHYNETWKRWSLDALPMLPEQFDLRVRRDGGRDQYEVVRKVLRNRDVTEVVNACDAGREGELIFRYVYELAGCKAPVRRFWASSLTEQAIRAAWGNLKAGESYDALADAARCRSESDWLVGLNATRAMTCKAREAADAELLSVGRVQTPTLAMIVARDREIEAFVPEPFWQVKATHRSEDGTEWQSLYFQSEQDRDKADKDQVPRAERLQDGDLAAALADAVSDRPGEVVTADRRRKVEPPPFLYDLTALQRRANQRYGMSAQQTLDVAQALYEKHKLITYPRTDARFLTPDQVPELADSVRAVGTLRPYAEAAEAVLERGINPNKRVVDASEVGDHHAILPTSRTPSGGSLSPDEKRIYDLVARRLLAVLSPDAVFGLTTLVVSVDVPPPEGLEAPLLFRAKGRVTIERGWQVIDPPSARKDKDLPNVDVGDPAHTVEAKVHEGATQPPKPYNDGSLLQAMETAGKQLDDAQLKRAMRSGGLGTPATRAAILGTLEHRKYILRRGKDLLATERGCALIDALPVEALKSPELTGRWEKRLTDIAEGREQRSVFMRDVAAYTTEVVEAIRASDPPPARLVAREQGPALGECPLCGQTVRERGKVYSCDSGTSCEFVVFKSIAKRAVSKTVLTQLLKGETTKSMKGFKSRAGKSFDAAMKLGPDGKVALVMEDREMGEVLGSCPVCDTDVRDRGPVFSCESGRECTFVIFKTLAKRPVGDDEVRLLLTGETTEPLKGFESRAGKPFEAALRLGPDGKVELVLGEREAGDVLGACPVCATDVRNRGPVYSCETGRDCSFVIFKTLAKRPIAEDEVRVLLSGETTAELEGFMSKKGSLFSAPLKLGDDGRVVFAFADRGADRPPQRNELPPVMLPVGLPCPECEEGTVIKGRTAWGCSRWREECTWKVGFEAADGAALAAELREAAEDSDGV